ncbi:hypothetical protein GDO78_000872 [Eleutherodactylus coqui]|uniref:NIPSNAP domain-containing protein n=1 Tax=Eleutherodactylus coqui TaxID=57060 RepID=A0A8J6FTM4_ELECQ|nr:hypothetical protein GDO78_000872 [Eleutherodactylus coqui]
MANRAMSAALRRAVKMQACRPSALLVRGFSASSSKAREDSWLKTLFVRKVDPRKDAHSNLLAKRETSNLYKIQCKHHSFIEEVLPKVHAGEEYPCTLVGTWNTWYGEQDQAVHLWRYEGGYPALTEVMNKLRKNKPGTMIEWGNHWDDIRNSAWQKDGWDECVYYTVPLIQEMESRIMIPLKSSPLQ